MLLYKYKCMPLKLFWPQMIFPRRHGNYIDYRLPSELAKLLFLQWIRLSGEGFEKGFRNQSLSAVRRVEETNGKNIFVSGREKDVRCYIFSPWTLQNRSVHNREDESIRAPSVCSPAPQQNVYTSHNVLNWRLQYISR